MGPTAVTDHEVPIAPKRSGGMDTGFWVVWQESRVNNLDGFGFV